MFRKTAWRKTASDVLNWHQDQAMSTTMFILKEFGPTGFLLKEDEEPKKYKVCLGDPHSCTCVTFQKEHELCKHICWILMRKFRLPKDHEYCFQLGLVERQILEVLQGLYRARTPAPPDSTIHAAEVSGSSQEDGRVRQKTVGEDDVCPICQERLLRKRLPVTYCRFGCGNNVHICCMKVWADHQSKSETDTRVKCPLCRMDFGDLALFLKEVNVAMQMCTSSERERLDRHLGIPCNNCRICPIVGKCFRCTGCRYYHLCEDCLRSGSHPQHSFAVRTKRNQPWQLLEDDVGHLFSKAQITDIHAEHTNIKASIRSDGVPEYILKSLPVVRVRKSSKLLEVGMQCRLCLRGFQLDQLVKTLPCRHKFHAGCIEMWLRQSHCCPLDWQDIYNPLTWNGGGGKVMSTVAPSTQTGVTDQHRSDLFIPGTGLQDWTIRSPALENAKRLDLPREGPLPPQSFETLIQGTRCLLIHGTPSGITSADPLELTAGHSREPKSVQKCRSLGQASGLVSVRSKTVLISSYTSGRAEGCRRTKHGLFLGPTERFNKAQPETSTLHGQVRPLRHASMRSQPGCKLSDLEPHTTSIPFSAKHQRNQE